MSTTYSDLTFTNYPDSCDSYEYMQDMTSDLMDLVSQYESLINSKKFSEAAQLLVDNPSLNRIYFNAEKYNKIIDSVKAIQRLYFSDIQKYIEELITYRGEYSSTVSYKKYDVVLYNSSAYLCISDSEIGILPTSDKWIQITLQGEQGEPGLGLSFLGIWSATTTYSKDSCVTYNNILYASTIDSNLAKTPSLNSDAWTVVFDISKIVNYDNSSSGLSSTNLQDAINELLTKIITNESNINTNTTNIATVGNDVAILNNNLSEHDTPIATENGAHGFRYYQNELQYRNNGDWAIIDTGSGGSYVGESAPSDTELLWIDTANGGVLKYYNGSTWTNIRAVWG